MARYDWLAERKQLARMQKMAANQQRPQGFVTTPIRARYGYQSPGMAHGAGPDGVVQASAPTELDQSGTVMHEGERSFHGPAGRYVMDAPTQRPLFEAKTPQEQKLLADVQKRYRLPGMQSGGMVMPGRASAGETRTSKVVGTIDKKDDGSVLVTENESRVMPDRSTPGRVVTRDKPAGMMRTDKPAGRPAPDPTKPAVRHSSVVVGTLDSVGGDKPPAGGDGDASGGDGDASGGDGDARAFDTTNSYVRGAIGRRYNMMRGGAGSVDESQQRYFDELGGTIQTEQDVLAHRLEQAGVTGEQARTRMAMGRRQGDIALSDATSDFAIEQMRQQDNAAQDVYDMGMDIQAEKRTQAEFDERMKNTEWERTLLYNDPATEQGLKTLQSAYTRLFGGPAPDFNVLQEERDYMRSMREQDVEMGDIAIERATEELYQIKDNYSDNKRWAEYDVALAAQDYDTAAAVFEDITGRSIDTTALEEDREHVLAMQAIQKNAGELANEAAELNIDSSRFNNVYEQIMRGAEWDVVKDDLMSGGVSQSSAFATYQNMVTRYQLEMRNVEIATNMAELGLESQQYENLYRKISTGSDFGEVAGGMVDAQQLAAWDKLNEAAKAAFDDDYTKFATTTRGYYETRAKKTYNSIQRLAWGKEDQTAAAQLLLESGGAENIKQAAAILNKTFPGLNINFSELIAEDNREQFSEGMGLLSSFIKTFGSYDDAKAAIDESGALKLLGVDEGAARQMWDSMKLQGDPVYRAMNAMSDETIMDMFGAESDEDVSEIRSLLGRASALGGLTIGEDGELVVDHELMQSIWGQGWARQMGLNGSPTPKDPITAAAEDVPMGDYFAVDGRVYQKTGEGNEPIVGFDPAVDSLWGSKANAIISLGEKKGGDLYRKVKNARAGKEGPTDKDGNPEGMTYGFNSSDHNLSINGSGGLTEFVKDGGKMSMTRVTPERAVELLRGADSEDAKHHALYQSLAKDSPELNLSIADRSTNTLAYGGTVDQDPELARLLGGGSAGAEPRLPAAGTTVSVNGRPMMVASTVHRRKYGLNIGGVGAAVKATPDGKYTILNNPDGRDEDKIELVDLATGESKTFGGTKKTDRSFENISTWVGGL